jgi:hypothetical protein
MSFKRDFELIDAFPGWDHADPLKVLDGSLGDVEDVSQGGSLHARAGVTNSWGNPLTDHLEFTQAQTNRPLVGFVKSQAVG